MKLDKNGYRPSLLKTKQYECFLCHRTCETARHEIFGASNRSKSKRYGLWVNLCPTCHTEAPYSAHRSKETRAMLQKLGQEAYEKEYGDDFLYVFGKNYKE